MGLIMCVKKKQKISFRKFLGWFNPKKKGKNTIKEKKKEFVKKKKQKDGK